MSIFDISTDIVNMFFMSAREKDIIEAAVRMFTRYGVKRTTMNDIAREAGIARQTLYNAYPNKDEILRATIRFYTDEGIAAVRAEWEACSGLADKLDILFAHMAVRPFELISASPDADDIISGFNAAGRDEIAAAGERYRLMIEELLAPSEASIRDAGLGLEELSDFVQRAAYGFKRHANDVEHLKTLLRSLNVMVGKMAS